MKSKMTRKLLPGEFVISTWQDLTLTSHRVWQVQGVGAAMSVTSLAVDAVSRVKLGRSHAPVLLWLGALAAAAAVAALNINQLITYILFAVALLLVVLYGTSRKMIIEILAGPSGIVVEVASDASSVEAAMDFLRQVEHARVGDGQAGPG